MERRIFISHATEDAAFANKLVDYIESNSDFKCWIAPRNIPTGGKWVTSINEAIRNCAGIVLIFSTNAVKSDWVNTEIVSGKSLGKNIIPFKLTNEGLDSDLYFTVNMLQWIDGTDNPKSKFPELLEALGRIDGRTQTLPLQTSHATRKGRRSKIIVIAVIALVVFVIGLMTIVQPWKGEVIEEQPTDSIMTEETSNVDGLNTDVPPMATNRGNERTGTGKTGKGTGNTGSNTGSGSGNTKDTTQPPKGGDEVTPPQPPQPPDTTDSVKTTNDSDPLQAKYNSAVTMFNAHRYQEALNVFLELKTKDPHYKDIDTHISSCRRALGQSQ